MSEAKIRSAGLCGVLGLAGESNLQGETQLDAYANQDSTFGEGSEDAA